MASAPAVAEATGPLEASKVVIDEVDFELVSGGGGREGEGRLASRTQPNTKRTHTIREMSYHNLVESIDTFVFDAPPAGDHV